VFTKIRNEETIVCFGNEEESLLV